MKKNSPMAQTMRLTLFGPIFIGLAQFIMYLLIRTYRCNKILVNIRKNKGKRKKILTQGPNNARHVVWACFHGSCPTLLAFHY